MLIKLTLVLLLACVQAQIYDPTGPYPSGCRTLVDIDTTRQIEVPCDQVRYTKIQEYAHRRLLHHGEYISQFKRPGFAQFLLHGGNIRAQELLQYISKTAGTILVADPITKLWWSNYTASIQPDLITITCRFAGCIRNLQQAGLIPAN